MMINKENSVGRATSCIAWAMFSINDADESDFRCGTS